MDEKSINDAVIYLKNKKLDHDTLNIAIIISGGRPGALLDIENKTKMKRLSSLLPEYVKILFDGNTYIIYNTKLFKIKSIKSVNYGKLLGYGPDCYDNLGGKYYVSFNVDDIYLFGWRCFQTPDEKYVKSLEKNINIFLTNINKKLDVTIGKDLTKEDIINMFIDNNYKTIIENLNMLYNFLSYEGGLLFNLVRLISSIDESKLEKFFKINKEFFVWILRFSNPKTIEMIDKCAGMDIKFNEKKRLEAIKEYIDSFDKDICKLVKTV